MEREGGCGICGADYGRKDHLKRHTLDKHPDIPHPGKRRRVDVEQEQEEGGTDDVMYLETSEEMASIITNLGSCDYIK